MAKRKLKRAKKIESHKSSKIKHLLNKLFLLNTKRILIILAIWILSVIAHNIINLTFEIEEKVFFLVSSIFLPSYLLVSILFFTRTHRKEE